MGSKTQDKMWNRLGMPQCLLGIFCEFVTGHNSRTKVQDNYKQTKVGSPPELCPSFILVPHTITLKTLRQYYHLKRARMLFKSWQGGSGIFSPLAARTYPYRSLNLFWEMITDGRLSVGGNTNVVTRMGVYCRVNMTLRCLYPVVYISKGRE